MIILAITAAWVLGGIGTLPLGLATFPWLLLPLLPGFVPFLTATFMFDTALSILFLLVLWWLMRGIGPSKPTPDSKLLNERLPFFDALKGGAIGAVILIHSMPGTKELLDFAVPLFVMASGYLLFKRYAGSLDIPAYAAKFVWRIVPIYLFIIVVSLLFLTNFPFTPGTVLFEAALGRTPWFGSPYSNYFIPLILLFYILFIPAHRLRGFLLGPIGLLLALLLSIAAAQQFMALGALLNPNSVEYALAMLSPWRMLFFFLLGGALADHPIERWPAALRSKLLVFSLLAMAICLVIIFLYQSNFVPFIYTAAVFLFFWSIYSVYSSKLPAFVMAWLERLGKCSLLIYLLQWVILGGLAAAGFWSASGPFVLFNDLFAFVVVMVVGLFSGELIQSAYLSLSRWLANRLWPLLKPAPAS